jgi:hypothetical protein
MISQSDLDAAPKVTLAGKEWPVPLLVPRQQRIVIPKLMSLMKTLAVGGAIDAASISTEQYDDLIDVIYHGIVRGSPTVTKEAFIDEPITLLELIKAIDVIAAQTGMMAKKEPLPGEALAGNSQTGTASSQE